MYTVDYLKTLHADYVEWNTDPGSMIMPEDVYDLDYASDDEIKRLAEIEDEDEDDFVESPSSTANNAPLRDFINEAWSEIYRQLGRNYKTSSNGKVFVLDDDDFLRTHWILYYPYSRKTGNDYIDYLLGTKFTAQSVMKNYAKVENTQELIEDHEEDGDSYIESDVPEQCKSLTLEEMHNYILDLRDTAEMWYYTWFPLDAKGKLDDEEITWTERINRLGIAYFRPLITTIFFNRNKKLLSKEKSIEILKAIERFIFIVFRMQTTRSHYGSSEFYKAARELHHGIIKADGILRMLNERINRSFDNEGFFKTEYMLTMVNKLFEQKDDERAGYYRWSALRYFLYEYNAELEKEHHGCSELKWESFKQNEKDKISIEHIFPHKAEGYWAEQFKDVEKDKWRIYEGSLGNLLLLSQKINAELQNDDFETKKNGRQCDDVRKVRVGYLKGSAAEREVYQEADWNPQTIEKVGLDMFDFMKKRWSVNFRSEEEIKKLLLPGIY